MASPDLNSVGRVAAVLALMVLVFIMFDGDLLMINQETDNGSIEIVQSHKGMDRVICFHLQESDDSDEIIFNYADYTESILGHKSRVLIPDNLKSRHGLGFSKFTKRFGNETLLYKPDFVNVLRKMEWHPGKSLPSEARRLGCDFLYILKSGETYSFPRYPEAFDSRVIRAGIHSTSVWDHHDKKIPAAALFHYVTDGVEGREVVPPIVRPPRAATKETLRPLLKINDTSIVVCSFGPPQHLFVRRSVQKLVAAQKDGKLHFLFLDAKTFDETGKFIRFSHPLLHYVLSNFSNPLHRDQFIDSCDALLHSRETVDVYGRSITDFAVRNKPVIAHAGGVNRDYLPLLEMKGHPVYHNESELLHHLTQLLEHGVDKTQNYNAFSEFSPEIVMQKFKKVFLDPVFGKLDGLAL